MQRYRVQFTLKNIFIEFYAIHGKLQVRQNFNGEAYVKYTDIAGILQTANLTSNSRFTRDILANTPVKIYGKITAFYYYGNLLTNIDLKNCISLTSLYCPFNPLTSLDLSNNTALTSLSCYDSQLTDNQLFLPAQIKNVTMTYNWGSNIQPTALVDYSQCTQLESLHYWHSSIGEDSDRATTFANNLPTYTSGTHKLTITGTYAPDIKTIAEAKGWTVTI